MEQGAIKMEETRKQLSKFKVIGSFIGMGMVGFCLQKMLIKWQKKIK